jgi:ABC-2 type transport system permease protein
MPAIAFVIGTAFSALAMLGLWWGEWFDGFSRGVISIGAVAAALAAAAAGIGAAVFVLASRRWRPNSAATVVAQVASLCFALVLAANVARIATRQGLAADTTSAGLSSLSKTSVSSIREIKAPVTITAFISKELPPELALKGKEVEDKVMSMGRSAPGQVEVRILRPADALDTAGTMATKEFGLKSRRQVVNTASGRRFEDVFLGAAITCAGRTQIIEHFDPGLSVEYELVRAVRAVSDSTKRILGIATTDLEVNGGFNYQTMQMTPGWEIVEEWKKQYEVRTVSLDSDVASDIEVLVVPQPSTLTQPQIEKLHDYIWAGRPALVLEDPLPFFQMMQGRADLIPSQAKRNPNQQQNQFGPPPDDGPKKGDLNPVMKALGIEWHSGDVVWSDYNPSHHFRQLIPENFVWSTSDRGGIDTASGVTKGINALLSPYPGGLRAAKDKPAGLSITPLLLPAAGSAWGINGINDLTNPSWRGGMELKNPQEVRRRPYPDQLSRPNLAVEITGTRPSAYPRVDPAKAKKVEAKPEDTKDEAKPEDKQDEEPAAATGVPSAKPVHVIVVADLDLIDNEFFQFYRNQGNRLEQDEFRILLDLKNVQFLANAVDALFNDQAYLDLRTRRPARRPLTRLEEVRAKAAEVRRLQVNQAMDDAQSKIDQLNSDFQASLSKIDQREDIDEATKAQEKERARIVGQRKLDAEVQRIQLTREEQERTLEIKQTRETLQSMRWVQILAVVIPSVILLVIAVIVFINKLVSERSNIPAARRRA